MKLFRESKPYVQTESCFTFYRVPRNERLFFLIMLLVFGLCTLTISAVVIREMVSAHMQVQWAGILTGSVFLGLTILCAAVFFTYEAAVEIDKAGGIITRWRKILGHSREKRTNMDRFDRVSIEYTFTTGSRGGARKVYLILLRGTEENEYCVFRKSESVYEDPKAQIQSSAKSLATFLDCPCSQEITRYQVDEETKLKKLVIGLILIILVVPGLLIFLLIMLK